MFQSILDESPKIIFSGFVGALTAYLFNLFHWQTTEKIRKREAICQSISHNIENLEDISLKYWLAQPSQDDHLSFVELKQLEILLKSRLRTQVSHTKNLKLHIGNSKKFKKRIETLESLNGRLFDIATGDDFESKIRTSRPSKCNRISTICTEIKFALAELSL